MVEETSSGAVETQVLCDFCKSPLHAGASVCHACGREQRSVTKAAKERRVLLFIAIGLAVVIGIPLAVMTKNGMERDAAVQRIVECAHLHNYGFVDASEVTRNIDMGMKQTGKGWRAGAQYAALSEAQSGLPSLGTCYITQQTLFSN